MHSSSNEIDKDYMRFFLVATGNDGLLHATLLSVGTGQQQNISKEKIYWQAFRGDKPTVALAALVHEYKVQRRVAQTKRISCKELLLLHE